MNKKIIICLPSRLPKLHPQSLFHVSIASTRTTPFLTTLYPQNNIRVLFFLKRASVLPPPLKSTHCGPAELRPRACRRTADRRSYVPELADPDLQTRPPSAKHPPVCAQDLVLGDGAERGGPCQWRRSGAPPSPPRPPGSTSRTPRSRSPSASRAPPPPPLPSRPPCPRPRPRPPPSPTPTASAPPPTPTPTAPSRSLLPPTLHRHPNVRAGKFADDERKLVDAVNGREYVATYEDKDGDWMLIGDRRSSRRSASSLGSTPAASPGGTAPDSRLPWR